MLRGLIPSLLLGLACGCHSGQDKGVGPVSPAVGDDGGGSDDGSTTTEVVDTASPPLDTGGGEDTGSTDPPCEEDCDQDGFTVEDGDCDDADPLIHPGAEDTPCSGVDEDCDGTEVTDVDGDGWDCWQVGGEDCDDEDASVNPDGVEIEDNWKDDDCDGYADLEWLTEWEPDVIWAGVDGDWYGSYLGEKGLAMLPDLDEDGFAEIAAIAVGTVYLLSGGGGASASAETDALGLIRVDGYPPWTFGQILPIADLDGDGKPELAVPFRSGDEQGVTLFTGSTLGAGGLIDSTGVYAKVNIERYTPAREKLASLDIDADGVEDLFVAEWWHEHNFGRVSRVALDDLTSGSEFEVEDIGQILWAPERQYYRLGTSMFSLGDLDGDGYPTLAVADYYEGTFLIDGDNFLSTEPTLELQDLDYAVIYQEDTSLPDSGSGSYPVNLISPGDLDEDGHPDLLLHDLSGSLVLDGTKTKGGHVDLFLDLWEGGSSSYAAANAHLTDTGIGSSSALLEMAGPATIGHQDQDIILTGKEGILFVGTDEIPLSGVLDLYGWSHQIPNDSAWACYETKTFDTDRALVVADLDGDGDDDVVCTNPLTGADLTASPYDPDYPPGEVSIFYNRN